MPLLPGPGRQVTKTMRTYAGCMNINTTAMTTLRGECIRSMSLANTVAMPILPEEGTTMISRPPNLVIAVDVRKCAITPPRLRTRTITAAPQLSSRRHHHKPMPRPRRRPLAQHSNRLLVQLLIVRRPALNMARRAGAGICATPLQRGLTITCPKIIQLNGADLAPPTRGKLSSRSSGLDLAIDATLSRRNHVLHPLNRGSFPHATRPPKDPWRPRKRDDALRLPSGGVLLHPTGAAHLRSSSALLVDSKRRADKIPPLPLPPLALPARSGH